MVDQSVLCLVVQIRPPQKKDKKKVKENQNGWGSVRGAVYSQLKASEEDIYQVCMKFCM